MLVLPGDASGAESASNRAAAKEMIKVAIADMAQGKLDAAEKELMQYQAEMRRVQVELASEKAKEKRLTEASIPETAPDTGFP